MRTGAFMLVTLGAGLMSVLGLKLLQAEIPSVSETIYQDAKACFDLVAAKTLDGPEEVLPAFSSQNVPSWAIGDGLLEFYDANSKPTKVLPLAYGRAWTYRVPPALVGRTWDSLSKTTVVLEIVGAPSDTAWVGVMKSGIMKTKPFPLPP